MHKPKKEKKNFQNQLKNSYFLIVSVTRQENNAKNSTDVIVK